VSARASIPEGFIQELLARTDIVDVIGPFVALRKGGANLLGLCPFHGEKSPSFTVSPSKQFFHCFGCGAHGDAIGFLMDHAGLGFVEALRDLAGRCGMTLPEAPTDPAERERQAQAQAQRMGITQALERAATHYRSRLKEDARAIAYLKRRGLTGAVARDFGLGYAPPGWRTLAGVFPQYDDPVLAQAGLVIEQGDGDADRRRYDRFRDRIMFPIRSVKGEIIGFGGRVLDQGEPKYLNSPETPVFVKGQELYGLFEARAAIRACGHALVVEGYMDVVALAQAGVGQAVATLGTACTPDHVRKLLRFTDRVVFSFDGDAAGRRAAARALEAALPHVNDLRAFHFLFLPAEHDPDSFVQAHGREAFEHEITQAMPLSGWLLAVAGEGCELTTPEGRARMVAQAQPLWKLLPPGAMRTQLLVEIAATARMELAALSELWGENKQAGAPRPARDMGHRPAQRTPRPARVVAVRTPQDQVARIVLTRSELWPTLPASDHDLLFGLGGWHGELFRWIERDHTEHGPREWPALRDALRDEPFGEQAIDLIDRSEVVLPSDADDLLAAVRQTAKSLALRETLAVLGRSSSS
jgi:DNA primase